MEKSLPKPLPDDIWLEVLSKLLIKTYFYGDVFPNHGTHLLHEYASGTDHVRSRKQEPYKQQDPFHILESRTYIDTNSVDITLSLLPQSYHPYINLIDCCNGLLFLKHNGALCVCNSATKKWTRVSYPLLRSHPLVLAFGPRRPLHYKIFSIGNELLDAVLWCGDSFHVFSSETGDWRLVEGIRGIDNEDGILVEPVIITFLNGTIYMLDLNWKYPFVIDVEGNVCRRNRRAQVRGGEIPLRAMSWVFWRVATLCTDSRQRNP